MSILLGEWALKRSALIFSLLALAVAGAPFAAQAATINVTAGAVDTTVNGNCSLIEAIESANTDTAVDACTAGSGADVIVIPAGTYTLTVVASMTAAGASGLPSITSDITLQGADAATTIIERSAAMGTPAFRHIQNLSTLTITGVTLTNGSDTVVGGGAIYNGPGSTLTVADSVFSNNTATTEGGALNTDAAAGATIVITDTTFTNNSANSGGAIANGDFAGGAVGTVTCSRCVFSGNTATDNGGGAIFSRGAVTLVDSLVSGNMATTGTNRFGGGLFATTINAGTPSFSISGTTFVGNSALDGGAVHAEIAAASSLVNSTFSGNTVTGSSGALFLTGPQTFTLNNVTMAANSAQLGGGLGTGPMASITFANTIVAGNTASGTDPDCSLGPMATATSMGFNLIGNNTGCAFTAATGDQVGTGASPIDPLLGALADNGGPDAGATPTAIPTHFPQPGSPALDAGNNVDAIGGAFPACRADDQRDIARPVGPRCDIGAVESSADADVAITKADSPDPVNRGDNLTYPLTVTNNGPGGAGDVTVVDTLPPGLAFVSAMPSQGTCMEAALMVTCDLGILANGASATIDIVVTTTAAGMLTNTATVSTTSNDPDLSNNSDTETTVVNPVTDISITKTDDADPVDVGDNITYTVTVANNGPDNATGVSLMDTLPASVNFVSATPSQGMCAEAGGLVTCNLGAVANGNTATVTIVVTTTANAVITNTVTVTADGADTNPGNNQASQSTSVGTLVELILSMADSPDPVAVVTGNLTYTVTVANAGPDQATGVTLTVTLPTSVNFGSATATMGTCSQSVITVTCNVGTLALQASATATIVVIPQTPGITVTGTATVTLNEADLDLSNNTASVDTEVVDFTLSVAPASVTVTRGNSAIYMVTLTPVGSRYDFAITLSCEMLPASATCAFVPAGAIPGGGPVTITLSVITTAPSSAGLRSPLRAPVYAVWLLAPLGLLVLGAGRRCRARAVLGLLLVLLVLQMGCGGSDEPPPPTTQPGTPVGTHTFTIRGTTGTLSHTATTMVVVQ